MNKLFKRCLALFTAFILCLHVGVIDSKADASVTIALSSSSVSIGGGVTATISVSGSDISAYTIYVSYDSSILQFNSASGSAQANGGGGTLIISGTGAGSVSASFTAIANGTASISTSGSEVYNINLEQIPISHAGASVTVATAGSNGSENGDSGDDKPDNTENADDGRSSNCNLASLQISPGTLEPAFSPSTTSYYVQVDEDVTSMVVSATTEDSNATTDVWGAGLIEPGENTVRITVTAENGAVKVYNIRVVAGEDLGDAVATIDNVLYTFVNDEENLEVPEGFAATTLKYKDWEVLAFESPNKKLKIVCLADENGENNWFIYDAATSEFMPYKEFSADFNRYIILPVPAGTVVPNGFVETEIQINNVKVAAYKSADIDDDKLYLVYAMNISGGEGFYLYDVSEAAFMRYVPMIVTNEKIVIATPDEATPTVAEPMDNPDDGFFTKQIMFYILCGAGALLIILIVCLIAFGSRIHRLNEELDKADDMIEQLASTNRAVNHSMLDADVKSDSVTKADEVNESETMMESDIVTEIPTLAVGEPDKAEDMEQLYVDFEKQSEMINNKIKDDYDADSDSAFADDEE